jgi:hypothetical protein
MYGCAVPFVQTPLGRGRFPAPSSELSSSAVDDAASDAGRRAAHALDAPSCVGLRDRRLAVRALRGGAVDAARSARLPSPQRRAQNEAGAGLKVAMKKIYCTKVVKVALLNEWSQNRPNDSYFSPGWEGHRLVEDGWQLFASHVVGPDQLDVLLIFLKEEE